MPAEKSMEKRNSFKHSLDNWIKDEKAAVELINISGKLRFEKTIELLINGRQINDKGAGNILNSHLFAQNILGIPVKVENSVEFARAVLELNTAPASIDLARLNREWAEEKEYFPDAASFIKSKLSHLIGRAAKTGKEQDVILYGFGRIGRMAARELITQAGSGTQLCLRAIVTRTADIEDIRKRAALFQHDSVHGNFPGVIETDEENAVLYVNGHNIKMIAADRPENADYEKEGINNALLIDSSGAWRDREGLEKHLLARGVSKVLLTAPGKGDIPNIVYGINHSNDKLQSEPAVSAASCTTNAIVPALSLIHRNFTIIKGHLETVHSYTNDQNLLDNYHKKMRRGRSAALNMVITDTGAAKAAARAVPELAGKLTANSIRVPTPDVSLAILYLTIEKAASIEEINSMFFEASVKGDLIEQIRYSKSEEFVSTDGVGEPCTSIYDSCSTKISADGRSIVIYLWYDNEYGYTMQVVRLAKYLTGVSRIRYY